MADSADKASMALKILYTLHGTDSDVYIVKPTKQFDVTVFREIELGTVEIAPILEAIQRESPQFASIQQTHSGEYAVFSVDYAEDGLPLQSHGRVIEEGKGAVLVTGKIETSKLMKEQLEVQIHILPIRNPSELIAEYVEAHKNKNEPTVVTMHDPELFPYMKQPLFDMPALPPPVQVPASLERPSSASSGRSSQELNLPSSPPPPDSQDSEESSESRKRSAYQLKTKRRGTQEVKKRKVSTSASSPKSEYMHCGNCGVETASTWRRIECPTGEKVLLCNACGLYFKSKGVMRPRFLWDKARTRENYERSLAAMEQTSEEARQASSDPLADPLADPLVDPIVAPPQPDAISDPPQKLWSMKGPTFMQRKDPSDRLLDPAMYVFPPPPRPGQLGTDAHAMTGLPMHGMPLPLHMAPPHMAPPQTPPRKSTTFQQHPDTLQKLFDVNTPEQRTPTLLSGSGSAGRWLRRAMVADGFEDFLRSPTPRKTHHHSEFAMLTSSPPTSSNLFSEINDWYSTASPSSHNIAVPLFKDETIQLPQED